jgi:hypothetical protein
VQFSVRSVFGRPLRLATRAAGHAFMRTHYRHYGRKGPEVTPLPSVPDDYDARLKRLRHRLGLTQEALARQLVTEAISRVDFGHSTRSRSYLRARGSLSSVRWFSLGGKRYRIVMSETMSARFCNQGTEGWPARDFQP